MNHHCFKRGAWWIAGSLIAQVMVGVAVAQAPTEGQDSVVETDATEDAIQAGDPTKRVAVKVIEVAGGRAYLEPGASAGIVRGVRVRLGEGNRRTTVRVIAATASYAIVDVGDARISEGLRGVAFARASESATATRLAAPTELAAFRGQWPQIALPADQQHPEHVPLGRTGSSVRDDQGNRVFLSANAGAIVPLSGRGGFVQGGLRARMHLEPWSSAPLAFDVDLATQLYDSRTSLTAPGQPSRPVVFARELSATYGTAGGYALSLGRLRYASQVHGMLDGARTRVVLGRTLATSLFAGAVPNPRDGTPWLSAARFGAEILYRDDESELRPSAMVVAHGSHFDGALDERRVQAQVSINPDAGYVNLGSELALQDRDNPWGAPSFAVQMVSADLGLRLGDVTLGTAARMQRPERSRMLDSLLPQQWLCLPLDPQRSGSDACSGDAYEYRGELSASHTTGKHRIDLRGFVGDASYVNAQHWGGQASWRSMRVFELLRAQLSAGFQGGQLYQSVNARVGLGVSSATGDVDADVYYRPAISRYRASNDSFVEHGVGVQVNAAMSDRWDLLLSGDAVMSQDVSVLLVQSQLNYRY